MQSAPLSIQSEETSSGAMRANAEAVNGVVLVGFGQRQMALAAVAAPRQARDARLRPRLRREEPVAATARDRDAVRWRRKVRQCALTIVVYAI